jgi:hypothetical protein
MSKLNELMSRLGAELHTKKSVVTEQEIEKAEIQLHGHFGRELKEYLLTVGSISCRSVELYGLGFSDDYYLNIVQSTKELRDMGLPEGFFPIYDIGDGHYAVVSADDHVFEWAYNEIQVNREISQSLFDYIESLLNC